ncbi:MAG: hydroxymethylbilane synthase [Omnitrophica bacterium RIFCSPHIGHO2_02_FULL_46_20]|nr:MAG: hydroxymethylbilane synthase [Omnitrophica bacterium RIFCSPHIGHO2_02_FULL_46_20]
MKCRPFIIGSRSSKLAMTQTRYVMNELKKFHPSLDFEIMAIKTSGDAMPDAALSKLGEKALFTKEIEDALSQRHIDLAVHSMKDLPTKLPKGLIIAAVAKREDPRDALVSKQAFTIGTLPKGCRVGTSSSRRRAQLLHARRDLNIVDLRGNVDTRIEKLRKGSYDAVILAHAGIKRLGLTLNLSVIPIEEMLPQAGQGALGIEVREDSEEVKKLVKPLDDADCHISVDAEREALAGLEGGCHVPIGVYANIIKNKITIKAGVFSLDGKRAVKDEIMGLKKDAVSLGRQLAERILKGEAARRILDEVKEGIRRDS